MGFPSSPVVAAMMLDSGDSQARSCRWTGKPSPVCPRPNRSPEEVASFLADLASWTLRAIGALALASFPAVAAEPGARGAFIETDCRYRLRGDPQAAADTEPLGRVWFPREDVFRPLVADMKQPRFYLSFRNVRFRTTGLPAGGQDDRIAAGVVGMGKEVGIWRRSVRQRCDGLQVNLFGAVFSQFNLDAPSDDLINTDFLIGPIVTFRRGIVSARLRLYHQSSHLGDELILNNPGLDRVNLSFEAFDGLISVEARWWRVYAGGGYIVSSETDLDEGLAQGGFELRGLRWSWVGVRCTAVFGADFQAFEARDWDWTTSLMGGIELTNPDGTNRFRVLLAYLEGSVPFGQFFNTEKIRNYGLQLQFDF